METEKIIRLSVRNLVEFILKEGDIDNRISGTLDKDAMLMGGRLHRKIQRMMGSNYQAEVSLKLQLPCDGFQLKLEGRADGILLESCSGKMLRIYLCQTAGIKADQCSDDLL